jgi:hypothetical protein
LPQKILRIAVPIVLIAAVVIAAVFWYSISRPAPEEAIISAILNAEENAERGSVSGVAKALSKDYTDAAGHTKRDITRMVLGGLRAGEWQFSVEVDALQVDSDTARSDLQVSMWPAENMSASIDYGLRLSWRREGRHWRIVRSGGWQGWLENEVGGMLMGPSSHPPVDPGRLLPEPPE